MLLAAHISLKPAVMGEKRCFNLSLACQNG